MQSHADKFAPQAKFVNQNFAHDSMDDFSPQANNGAMKNSIRVYRKRCNLTLEELAARIGMTAGHLSRMERGETAYTPERLEALARELRCKPADLIDDDPPKSEKEWKLRGIFRRMSATEQDQLIRLAVALAPPQAATPDRAA